ncbi:addiction module protein [Flavobacterium sp. I3-2]|uniref:addiction module protein n=1 Tax=Flavobacterium sp. I3-2 TaxID=2748319 RepID=UPI0015B0145C|nr:addiction module protein [Flavobacterium sp. I3-2]
MNGSTIKQINAKLKQLPEDLLEDVERYIDFLTFRYKLEKEDIPQWQKNILDKRLDSYQNSPDDVLPIKTLFEILDKDV